MFSQVIVNQDLMKIQRKYMVDNQVSTTDNIFHFWEDCYCIDMDSIPFRYKASSLGQTAQCFSSHLRVNSLGEGIYSVFSHQILREEQKVSEMNK